MDPVTVSIILATVGWLVNATISKNAGDAWQKYVKLLHLQKENDNLRAELEKIKLLVEAAESAKLPMEKVKLLDGYLKKIKELICEANNLLDELEYFRLQEEVKKMNKPKKGNTFSRLIPFAPSDVPTSSTAEACKELKLYKRAMSSRFKDLTKKLKKEYESLNPTLTNQILGSIASGIQTVTNKTTPISRHQTSSLCPTEIIYGRDDDKNCILKPIKDAEQYAQKLPVITIEGQGGVGKTTLARLIYNEMTTSFSKKIWICVSTNFDVMSITREMLEFFHNDGRKCDGNNLSKLQEILRDGLKNERVLLVLDDIWEINSKEVWDSLLNPFNPSTSTVLVTTRNPCIADMIRTIGPIIELHGLEENSILSLFKTWTFGDDKYNIPYSLEDIAREIVEELKGNPLAAKTVGSLLKENLDRTHWKKILESEKWKLLKGDNNIMPVLRLSYDLLPVHLQRCFSYCSLFPSYCSLFPEDYHFEADELVYIWMANNFICTNGNVLAEVVGHEYLQALVGRAFFQPIVTKWGVQYELHDLMHDLARGVTLEEKQFLVIDHRPHIPGNPHLRHLSIHPGVDTIDKSIKFQNLNSLIVLEDDDKLCDGLNWDKAKRVHLRLLVLPYTWSISYNFSNFIHLRFLKLDCSVIRRNVDEEWVNIPPELCRLYHLQVLELENTWNNIKELPKEFNDLVNLRHFIANKALHSMITELEGYSTSKN